MQVYPVVKVETSDGLVLHGLYSETQSESKTVLLHVHGTAGNFFSDDFLDSLVASVHEVGISSLLTNNRGAGVYEIERGVVAHGASLERFEDCLIDIDAWIEFALDKGYGRIVLSGHSFGTEKIVYYMEKGKHKDKIVGVILLGFSDNVGTMQRYLAKIGRNYEMEARNLVKEGRGYKLLDDIYGLAGELPISAQTYLNFTSENSENSNALPLRQGHNLIYFQNIKVPILGVIGDKESKEYTIITIQEAIELLKSENEQAEVFQIIDCNHNFEGKGNELASIVGDFLKRRIVS